VSVCKFFLDFVLQNAFNDDNKRMAKEIAEKGKE